MPKTQSHAADLRGLSRLTVSAVVGVAELAEALHMTILDKAIGAPLGKPIIKPIAGATALVYRGVRGAARLVGGGIDSMLARLVPMLGEQSEWAGREALLAGLNGVLGDHLAEVGNPLAIPMTLRRAGHPLTLERAALREAIPGAGGRILVLAHGLCMNDLQWQRAGHDHGAGLERERGYTALYLHYNSGLHISTNGRAFAQLLQTLVEQWPQPVEEIVIVGHSMGGLVARGACAVAAETKQGWLKHLSKIACLGTPHHGAPLERGGNWVHVVTDLSPYSKPFSRLAKIRSAGITDLRHGSVQDEDWDGKDRFAHGAVPPMLALPASVHCYAVAATMGAAEGDLTDRVAGDGLVPLASALGQHAEASRCLHFDDQWVGYKLSHMGLLSDADVYRQLLSWL